MRQLVLLLIIVNIVKIAVRPRRDLWELVYFI